MSNSLFNLGSEITIGVVAGAVIGGVAVLVITLLLILVLLLHQKRKAQKQKAAGEAGCMLIVVS